MDERQRAVLLQIKKVCQEIQEGMDLLDILKRASQFGFWSDDVSDILDRVEEILEKADEYEREN